MERVAVCYHIQLIGSHSDSTETKVSGNTSQTLSGLYQNLRTANCSESSIHILNNSYSLCRFFKMSVLHLAQGFMLVLSDSFHCELSLGMRLLQWLTSHTLLHNVNRKGVGLFSRVGLFLGDCSTTGAYEPLREKEHQTSIPVSNHTLKMRLTTVLTYSC